MNLKDKRFGRWTVIASAEPKGRKSRWLCRCDCGTERIVYQDSLVRGLSSSCGCYRPNRRHNLLGQRFGKWTVIAPAENYPGTNKRRWLCRCDCGNEKVVNQEGLLQGTSTSCGCALPEKRRRDIAGQRFGLLTALYPVGKKEGKGSNIYWRFRCDCGKEIDYSLGTIDRAVKRGDMHISCGDQKVHKPKTYQEGTSLSVITSKKFSSNTSGVRGVSYRRRDDSWAAYITFQGKRKYLGQYKTLEAAAAARKRAEDELFAPIIDAHKDIVDKLPVHKREKAKE